MRFFEPLIRLFCGTKDGSDANPEFGSDCLPAAIFCTEFGNPRLVNRNPWPTQLPAPCPACSESRPYPIPHQFPLKLRDRCKDAKDKPAVWC